jgi:hypothetical protein
MFLETSPYHGTQLVLGIFLHAFRMQNAVETWPEYDVFQGMDLHRAGTIAGGAWKVARFHLAENKGERVLRKKKEM